MIIENLTASRGDWASVVVNNLTHKYTDENGLLVSVFDGVRIVDCRPLISDMGDVLPFLSRLGEDDFVSKQIELSMDLLDNELYVVDGYVSTFHNHDYIFGLLELYEISGQQRILDAGIGAVDSLLRYLWRRNRLIDKRKIVNDRRLITRSSPFNGGYIEIFVELSVVTGDSYYLDLAELEARAWTESAFFRKYGLFRRINIVESEIASSVASRFAKGPLVRIFKDNTNLMFGLVALYEATSRAWVFDAIHHWVQGFEARCFNGGATYMYLTDVHTGREISLKSGFSVIDLLCDVYFFVHSSTRMLDLAVRIADFWLSQQWDNGLFPAHVGAGFDHLDANTDMCVSMLKLFSLTAEHRFLDAAHRCLHGILNNHHTPNGYILAVERSGKQSDTRVIVKYQGLLLKLALVDWGNPDVYSNASLYRILRDR